MPVEAESLAELPEKIVKLTKRMKAAAQELNFEEAARLRDRVKEMEKLQVK